MCACVYWITLGCCNLVLNCQAFPQKQTFYCIKNENETKQSCLHSEIIFQVKA